MKDYSFYLEGSGDKGVLLVHGLTGAPKEMSFIGKKLHKMGFSVYAPVLAGHCVDEATLINTTYEDWVDGLRHSLHDFKKRVKTVSTAGICVGGALALQLAAEEKDKIEKVAVYAPALDYDGWNQPKWSKYARIFKSALIHVPAVRNARFADGFPFGIKDERIRKFIVENPSSMDGVLPDFPASALYQNYRLNDALKKSLPEITIPTLLIHAKEDDVSHPRNSYSVQKKHGGDCTVVILEDSYHLIHVDRERHKVAQLTGEFFGAPNRQGTPDEPL